MCEHKGYQIVGPFERAEWQKTSSVGMKHTNISAKQSENTKSTTYDDINLVKRVSIVMKKTIERETRNQKIR